MIYNIMDEQQEREKLLSFGLTEDVIEIVIAKKRTLERQKSCVIIADPIPIPIQEQIDIIPAPEPEIPVVGGSAPQRRSETKEMEIKEQEEPKLGGAAPQRRSDTKELEIKQETLFYGGMPIWKRRLLERTYKLGVTPPSDVV